MVPAFGVSAGDFIAAIKLITNVIKALRDTSFASNQYQEALDYLTDAESSVACG
jgi:hypothetical protein